MQQHAFGWEGQATTIGQGPHRVLLAGDSMTHTLARTSPGDMYYVILSQRLGVQVFAYAGAGYGTLQEYLAVDRYLDTVKPDLVVLQTSFNDFVNNSWAFEVRSHQNNNFAFRPYLEDGHIVFRFPSRVYPPILLAHSRLSYLLASEGARVGAMMSAKGILATPEKDVTSPWFRQSALVTEQIIVMLKARLGPVPLVAFSADSPDSNWQEILQRQRVPYFLGVHSAVLAEERRLGASIRPDGAHWDARGHRVAGEVLSRWLSDYLKN
jgi:hypothetical protein